MDALARDLLNSLLTAAERHGARLRSRKAALTESHLAPYQKLRVLRAREAFEATMEDARTQGAVDLEWDGRRGEGHIERVAVRDAHALARFLDRPHAADRLREALDAVEPLCNRFAVMNAVAERWSKLGKVRGLGTESAKDWVDAARVIDFARDLSSRSAAEMPLRVASSTLFADSKRIEQLAAPIDVLLKDSIQAEASDAASVWRELGLPKDEQPALLAGRVVVERNRVKSLLDAPYSGFKADTVVRLASQVSMILSVENLTSFHIEARARCEDQVLVLYTAGMPSPSWRAMYRRLVESTPTSVPVFHYGDIDEGGFRIAARLAEELRGIDRVVQPLDMDPSGVATTARVPASATTVTRMAHFAALAGWNHLITAITAARITSEQESRLRPHLRPEYADDHHSHHAADVPSREG